MTGLRNAKAFFDEVRDNDLLGPTLSADEVKGCNALLAAFGGANWPLSWAAYGFGTAMLETAGTMLPISEYGGNEYKRRLYDITGTRPTLAAKMGNTAPGDGVKYAGRGYPQLTWKVNYQRADRELSLNGALVTNPDLAMRPDIAAKIMVLGMSEGWFTGKKLNDYLPRSLGNATVSEPSFVPCRKIINGQDRAADVAHFAFRYQQALSAGGWA